MKSQSGQVKFQTKKWRVIFSVFWTIKMTSSAPQANEVMAPPLIPARVRPSLGV